MVKTGGFREGFEGSQDYDLILRVTERAEKIVHIPKILYHWRISPDSILSNVKNKPQAEVNGKKAIEEHLIRVGLKGNVEYGENPFTYRVVYKIQGRPKISIIMTLYHQKGLKKCINSIIDKSTYANYEIIIGIPEALKETILQNSQSLRNKSIKIIEYKDPLNYSKIKNLCAKKSSEEFLLFLKEG